MAMVLSEVLTIVLSIKFPANKLPCLVLMCGQPPLQARMACSGLVLITQSRVWQQAAKCCAGTPKRKGSPIPMRDTQYN